MNPSITEDDYKAHINSVTRSAQQMHASDPARPELAWFAGKFIADRTAANQILFTFARDKLGHELGGVAAVETVPGRKVPRRVFTVLNRDDVFSRPPPKWLIKGLLVENSFTIFYAQSQSLKTYVLLNIMGQVATGGEFFAGRPLRQAGVLYLALEGEFGLRTRIDAWERHQGERFPNEFYRQIEDWQSFLVPGEVENFIENLQLLVDDGFPLSMIAIDTASKALGGGDTLSHKDALAFCAACIRIQKAFGCSLILVHHCGKNEDGGIIGSNAWFTEPDCVIEVKRHDKFAPEVVLIVEKQKTGPSGQQHKMLAHTVEIEAEGEDGIHSDLVVLVDEDAAARATAVARANYEKDAVAMVNLLGRNGCTSASKLLASLVVAGAATFTGNGKGHDRIREIVPKGFEQARRVHMPDGEVRCLWVDEKSKVCTD